VVVEGVNDGIRPSVGFLYVLFSSAVRIIKLLCLLPNWLPLSHLCAASYL